MTMARREIVGRFTEDLAYTVDGKQLKPPVWTP
nr:MAG TPA: MAZG-LIKE NUCLEOSIDE TRIPHOSPHATE PYROPHOSPHOHYDROLASE [Caudoviricetes sp.]